MGGAMGVQQSEPDRALGQAEGQISIGTGFDELGPEDEDSWYGGGIEPLPAGHSEADFGAD